MIVIVFFPEQMYSAGKVWIVFPFISGIFKHQLNLLQSALSDLAGGDKTENKNKQSEVLG